MAGRRRASDSRRPLLVRSLPSAPFLAGVAVLAISAGGALSSADPDLVGNVSGTTTSAAAALSTAGGQALSRRTPIVSRAARRDAPTESVDAELLALAEKQAAARRAKLAEMRAAAATQAAKIKDNKWVLPLASYELTATFGESSSLWANYHTGLDFNGESGDPIRSIANGTVTSAGYDGAYGNRTVVTLDDGTEIWYCHQTSIFVSVGEQVRGGQTIGTVGATGNVTGSHLHLEVRPGGGDPIDPFDAFVEHGIVP